MQAQRVQSTDIVDSRVSILGLVIMIWEFIPHNSTQDPLGTKLSRRTVDNAELPT